MCERRMKIELLNENGSRTFGPFVLSSNKIECQRRIQLLHVKATIDAMSRLREAREAASQ